MLQVVFAMAAAALLSSCGGSGTASKKGYLPTQVGGHSSVQARGSNLDIDSYWDGDGVVGPPRIVIDLSDQMAYFYKGAQKVGVSRIASGKRGIHDTPIGDFKIIQKSKDHESNLFGDYV